MNFSEKVYQEDCKISSLSPAKVNLRLKVFKNRPDGYHDLEMIMVKLDLADEIDFELTRSKIEIISEKKDFPSDGSNLIYKTALLVQKESGKSFGLKAHVKKKIPISAGLGGGSSNSATTLKALNTLLDLQWNEEKLKNLGVQLGADVPFFLTKGSQKAEGIGEKLSPLFLPPLFLILMNPGFPLSTPEVYRWYDERGSGGGSQVHEKLTTHSSNVTQLPFEFKNDLEKVVLPRYPVLAEMKNLLMTAGALGTLMSGSGPTIFALFESKASQNRGYEKMLQKKDPHWWICKTKSKD